jgi:putative membrane protein
MVIAPLFTLAAAGLAYGRAVRRTRRWPVHRSACFGAGLVVLAVALATPLDTWADRLQSAHMAQHMLLLLVAPPLLCAGAPATLALRTVRPPARRRLASVLRRMHPAAGFVALAATLLAVHLTPLYEAEGALHVAEHVALVTAGLLFWAPLVGADPHGVGAAGRIAAALAAMAPMGALSAVLLTAAPRSARYAQSAAAAGVDPASDQRAAAIVMWVGGGLVLTAAVLVLAGIALWQEEQRMRRREAVGAR